MLIIDIFGIHETNNYKPCDPKYFRPFRSISYRVWDKNFLKKNGKIANLVKFPNILKNYKISKYVALTYYDLFPNFRLFCSISVKLKIKISKHVVKSMYQELVNFQNDWQKPMLNVRGRCLL